MICFRRRRVKKEAPIEKLQLHHLSLKLSERQKVSCQLREAGGQSVSPSILKPHQLLISFGFSRKTSARALPPVTSPPQQDGALLSL